MKKRVLEGEVAAPGESFTSGPRWYSDGLQFGSTPRRGKTTFMKDAIREAEVERAMRKVITAAALNVHRRIAGLPPLQNRTPKGKQ